MQKYVGGVSPREGKAMDSVNQNLSSKFQHQDIPCKYRIFPEPRCIIGNFVDIKIAYPSCSSTLMSVAAQTLVWLLPRR